MIEGIIVDVRLGSATRLYIRRGENKDVIKIIFRPKVYVKEENFYLFERLFGQIIIDVDFLQARIGLENKREPVAEIKTSYEDYLKLRKIADKLSFDIFHIDIYPENMVLRVPSLNKVSIYVSKSHVEGEYLWGLNPRIPDELRIYHIEENGYGIVAKEYHSGEAQTFSSISEFISSTKPDVVVSRRKIRYPGVLWVSPEELEYGAEGLLEKAYFSYAQSRRVPQLTIGGAVESRQQQMALRSEIVLPRRLNNITTIGRIDEYSHLDVGGLIIAPKPGVYYNVVALDFTSLFPSIIVKYNISYETVDIKGIKRTDTVGFLPRIVKEPLERRLFFKKLGTQEAKRRANILKLLLVSCYGYAGKLDNRFGNLFVNLWINRIARDILYEFMVKAKELGFEIVYADTDSIFVRGNKPIEKLLEWAKKKSLPIKIENQFEKIVFVRRKDGHPAVKRYYGKTIQGKIIIKGLIAVRKDTPRIIREFQTKAINAMLQNKNPEQIYQKYKQKILNGIRLEEAKITIKFRKNWKQYRGNSPIARLARRIKAKKGQKIEVIPVENGYLTLNKNLTKVSSRKLIKLLKQALSEIIPNKNGLNFQQ